jgi:aspartate carbamoyltransferase catalytic subunit
MKVKNGFLDKDILSVDQFSKKDLSFLFKKANAMKKIVNAGKSSRILQGKIMTALFYEPSSRTFGSFISAMQRLGGGVIPLQGMTYSSVAKGETLEDTIRTFECYSDIIVIRHPEVGSAKRAALISKTPIINAGDGIGEHPTQALLDLFTILSKFKKIDGLKVAFVGDLLNGRTVHSLSKLLTKMGRVEFFFVSPKILRMPLEIKNQLKNHVKITEMDKLDGIINKVNVIYVTRIQKERFSRLSTYEKVKNFYIVNKKFMEKAGKNLILMHPLPRISEIDTDVDNDPRAVYLTEQMRNGLYVRMALLAAVLGKIK